MKHRLGLVVPALADGGGVPAVARFVADTACNSGDFDIELVSLAMDSRDPCSMGLTRPSTWLRGAAVREGLWEGRPYAHVGSVFSEFEFQRYRPRKPLHRLVADCDILQVVCGSPAAAYAVCGLSKPVALQCATRAKVERRRRHAHDDGVRARWRRLMTHVTDRIDDLALRSVDAIQLENPWMYEYATRVNAGRDVDIRYAPPGIDARRFSPVRDRQLTGDGYILCVGRLDDPRKNVDLLLHAYARLPATVRSRVRLVLAGQALPAGPFWQRAEALGVRSNVSVRHRPTVDELVQLYQGATAFVLPSDEEGLGVALLEAMACGAAVVSTRSGGPDGIIVDGANGYLVNLDDVDALASRITTLCSDVHANEAMGREARATIEQRYSDEAAGKTFLEMWQRLLQRARRA